MPSLDTLERLAEALGVLGRPRAGVLLRTVVLIDGQNLYHGGSGGLVSAVLGSELTTCAEQVNALLHESELGVVFETLVPGRPEDYAATFEEGTRELFRRVGTVATTGAHSP